MDEIKRIVTEVFYKEDDNLKDPEILIKINDKIVLTENSFITISGLPKSRKTTFMQMFLNSAIANKTVFGINMQIKQTDKIVIVDTEQSAYNFTKQQRFLKNMLNVGKMPKRVSAFLFRRYEPEVVMQSIEYLLEKIKPRILFIDNLTDLVYNPNDPIESKKVVNFLKKITDQYNIGIVTLLHLNKSNNFTTGHLGAMADRAAESVIRVELDKDTQISTLSVSMMRSDSHFEPISISFNNETKLYDQCETPNKEDAYKSERPKKFSMAEFTDTDLKSRIEITFEHQKEFTYKALVSAFKTTFGRGDTIIKQTVIPYLIFKKLIRTKDGIYKI